MDRCDGLVFFDVFFDFKMRICHQVICITHLPQIAAMADSHFDIEKNVEENETVTSIHPLSKEDSVRELARMLGGAKITDSVLANASEMKELAQVQKSARLKYREVRILRGKSRNKA